MREIWKDIPGYEGLYQVSNLGRVKSLDRLVIRRKFGQYIKKSHLMSSCIINSGREAVRLTNGHSSKLCLVHRLVAEAFIPNPSIFPQVNHIDGDPLNNRVDNLEWCDQRHQEIHKLYNLGVYNSSLLAQPKPIKRVEDNKVFVSLGEASRKTGVPLYMIFSRLQNGKPDKNGNHWKYVV